jgi:hypothetical protein
MRTFDVDLFEFSARTNVQDFDGLAGLEQSFEFEWVNCFHGVPSLLKRNEPSAPALVSPWLLLRISCPNPQEQDRQRHVESALPIFPPAPSDEGTSLVRKRDG